MKRAWVWLPEKIDAELDYFVEKYGVTKPYVLQLAYKLSNRSELEKIIRLKKLEE